MGDDFDEGGSDGIHTLNKFISERYQKGEEILKRPKLAQYRKKNIPF